PAAPLPFVCCAIGVDGPPPSWIYALPLHDALPISRRRPHRSHVALPPRRAPRAEEIHGGREKPALTCGFAGVLSAKNPLASAKPPVLRVCRGGRCRQKTRG